MLNRLTQSIVIYKTHTDARTQPKRSRHYKQAFKSSLIFPPRKHAHTSPERMDEKIGRRSETICTPINHSRMHNKRNH